MPEKILIVDDDLAVNVLVSKALQKAGYETRTAFTADEALMRAGQDRYDLIITDLRMPKIDGVELIRRLAQRGVADTVPIVVLSAHLDDATCKVAGALGAVDFVPKPFEPSELVLRVKRAIDRGPRMAQSQRWARPPGVSPAPAGAAMGASSGVAPRPAGAGPPPLALPGEAVGPPLPVRPDAHAPAPPPPAPVPAPAPPPAPATAPHGGHAFSESDLSILHAPSEGKDDSSVVSQRRARDARFSGKFARELAGPAAERPDCLGTLEHIRIPELIRFLHLPRRSGIIELQHGEERGEISIRDGEVMRAAISVNDREIARAVMALRQMFSWQSGRFRIAFCEIAPGPAFPKVTSAILAEAFG